MNAATENFSVVNYYLSSQGNVTGPFTRAVLEDSFRSGQIDSSSQICPEGTERWQSIQDLFVIADTGIGEQLAAPQQEVHIHNTYVQPKSPGVAILLEILPGFLFQTFGIGNLYAGSIATGLVLMLTYWAMCVLNFLLLFIVIGYFTWPITWCIYLVIAIFTANNAANRDNAYHASRSYTV